MSLESSLQRHREDAIKWKRSVLKIKLDASTEMLSCEESNARRAHILQDALRNEESRSRRLEESLACSRAEVAHERHLRVVLEKKAEERSRQFDSAESSLREMRNEKSWCVEDRSSLSNGVFERENCKQILRDTLNALEREEITSQQSCESDHTICHTKESLGRVTNRIESTSKCCHRRDKS